MHLHVNDISKSVMSHCGLHRVTVVEVTFGSTAALRKKVLGSGLLVG